MTNDSWRRTPERDAFQSRVRDAVEAIDTISASNKGMALVMFRGESDPGDTKRQVELTVRLRDLALAEQAWTRELPATSDEMLESYRLTYRFAMARIEVQAGLLMAEHPDSQLPKEVDDFLTAWKEWASL